MFPYFHAVFTLKIWWELQYILFFSCYTSQCLVREPVTLQGLFFSVPFLIFCRSCSSFKISWHAVSSVVVCHFCILKLTNLMSVLNIMTSSQCHFFFKPLKKCTVKFTISSASGTTMLPDVTVFYISGRYA